MTIKLHLQQKITNSNKLQQSSTYSFYFNNILLRT